MLITIQTSKENEKIDTKASAIAEVSNLSATIKLLLFPNVFIHSADERVTAQGHHHMSKEWHIKLRFVMQ